MNEKLRSMTSIYLTRKDQILMLYRQGGRVVSNVWVGSAGGHFEKEEFNDAKACVLRELYEELGITAEEIDGLTLKYITLRGMAHEIRQNYYFFAELKDHVERPLISNEGECRWFPISEVSSLEMPFTAKYVVEHYIKEGMLTDKLYGGLTNENGVFFAELPAF